MAPKKKGRKKEEAPKEEPAEDVVPENSREFYLIQIRDLEGRVARYQQKWDELQVSEDLFRSEYDKIVRDNREIVAFLKKTLNQRVEEISALTDQLQNLQFAKDVEKDAFEAQLVQMRHEFQKTKDQLMSENMVLSGKLASLEEFRTQKDELMAKFADLEEQLKKQEADHKEYIYNLEKKAMLDKERLKKEMLHRVNVVASEFRKVSNSQMAETTKRAIRENATISFQLTKITDQSLQLAQENDRLKEACRGMTKQLDMLEHNEKVLTKNGLSNQKLIKMLTNKCKELQAQVDRCAHQQKALTELQKAKEDLEKQVVLLKAERKQQTEQKAQEQAEQQRQAKLLQQEQQRRKAMEIVLRQTAQGLTEILSECPVVEEEDQFLTFYLWRNDVLQGLLNLLNQGVAHAEDQLARHPFQGESREVKLSAEEIRSYNQSTRHLKASRMMSHCQLSGISKSWTAHSMPTLNVISQINFLDPLRSYASSIEVYNSCAPSTAPQSLISWKQPEDSKEVVVKEEHGMLEPLVADSSEALPSVLGEEEGAHQLSLTDESSSLKVSGKAGM